jgi:16S rRNA (guanine966-N2)-methyltransferase
MRLSGGELRSRRVHVPRGTAIRPTPGRVREALFSILGERVVGARVLDLYAGSGAVGFEAASRGAAHVTFVESNARTAARIRALARELDVTERTAVLALPAERAARQLTGPYDFVFADPPYALSAPALTFAALRGCGAIGPQTLVVYEHRARTAVVIPGFRSVRSERYGEVALEFMQADA